MDLITDLPKSKGFDSILSVVDHGLTKGIILIPTMKEVTLEGIVALLMDNLFRRFGIPDKVISDRDLRFIAKSIKAFLQGLGVKQAISTCYDLAKWLSHYLYFFSFSFLRLTTTRWSAGKYHVTLSQCHNGVMDGHVTGHSHSVSHD